MSDIQRSLVSLGAPDIVQRFRILVIGNANAGKTTILNKVCNGKTDLDKPTTERGEHRIEDGVVYPTAHGFIFHDSCGFEAGGSDELKRAKDFIRIRSEAEELKDQLHVIWYCLSTSDDRPLTKAEMSMFESGTGNGKYQRPRYTQVANSANSQVPVVAIFTKMDALEKKEFGELITKGVAFSDAKKQATSAAEVKFETDFLEPLKKVRHIPAQIVKLRDMHKEEKDCDELLLSTAEAIDKDALKLLVQSQIRNSLKDRVEVAVEK